MSKIHQDILYLSNITWNLGISVVMDCLLGTDEIWLKSVYDIDASDHDGNILSGSKQFYFPRSI